MATKPYDKPEWSSLPLYDYSLEVVKQGVALEEIVLRGKEYFFLGRQHDVVDIPMDHPSLSRRHAVLNFRNDGALMLQDLQSAQGTFLNKTRCDPAVYYKLNVGDLIKFGASTRLYIVKGPDEERPGEYESANLAELREKLAKQEVKRKAQAELANIATWGMDFDDEEEESNNNESKGGEEEDEWTGKRPRLPEYLRQDEHYDRKYSAQYSLPITADECHNEKDRAVYEKLVKKERKIQHMQEETKRIYMKEQQQDGLTPGQQAAVTRNDGVIATLQQEIDSAVANLREKYAPSAPSTKRRKVAQEEEEGTLDTTALTADVRTNWRLRKKLQAGNAPSSSTGNSTGNGGSGGIVGKRDWTYHELQDAHAQVEAQLREVQAEAVALASADGAEGADTVQDEVEAVVQAERRAEGEVRRNVLAAQATELGISLQHLQTLLQLSTPSLPSLQPHNNHQIPHTAEDQSQQQQQHSSSSSDRSSKKSKSVGIADDSESVEEERKRSLLDFQVFVQQTEQQQQHSGQNEPEEEKQEKVKEDKQQQHNKEKRKATVQGPQKHPGQHNHNNHSNNSNNNSNSNIKGGGDLLQGGDVVWVPPKAQTGDGRTALNDKFGY